MATEDAILEATMNNLLKTSPKKVTTNNTVTISRIPDFIIDKHKDQHKPTIVPIGAYHYHHDDEKFKAINEHKRHYLHDFLERNKEVNPVTYLKKMQSLKDRAHKCYSDMELDDDKFVQMLLLDGCFILELLFKLEADQRHRLCWAGSNFMTILSDLLLIENQIPFFVLKELYTTLKGLQEEKGQAKSELVSLVVNNLFLTYLGDSIHPSQVKELLNHKINHLLHLYHEVSLRNPENEVFGNTNANTVKTHSHRIPLVIPSATQLLEFGFVLRKQDSRNNSNATIKNSTIKIPRLIIDSTRKTLLMNLLLLEHSLGKNKSRWTGLMVMMNCMIKSKEDLRILQSRGIVLNLLPNEDEAIDFFRQLSEQVIADFNDHYYSDLFEQVHLSCEAYFRRKRASFMHEYFNNRWAIISFCTSICAIFLASVQTLVSVFTYRHRY